MTSFQRSLVVCFLALGCLVLGGCVSGSTVLVRGDIGEADASMPDDAHSPAIEAAIPPAICTEPLPYPIGATTAPGGPPAIVIDPLAQLDGEVTVVSVVRTDGVLTLTIDDAGVTRTITIGDTATELALTPGEVVLARTEAGSGGFPARDVSSLVLREPSGGVLVGAYIRNIWRFEPDLGRLLHASPAIEGSCVIPTGGQCGRGVWQMALRDGDDVATQGESLVVSTPEGDIEIHVGALHNDGSLPPDTTVCAIGTLGSVAIDARPAP